MKTAEPIATGPFDGFFPHNAVLYRLDPPCVAGGYNKWRGVESKEVTHVIVTALDGDEHGCGPVTTLLAAKPNGQVDGEFFLRFGPIVELSVNDAEAALARLGY